MTFRKIPSSRSPSKPTLSSRLTTFKDRLTKNNAHAEKLEFKSILYFKDITIVKSS